MDRDPEGQSSGYDMISLQTVPAILKVCWNCHAERENCFQQFDKLAGHVGEGLHLQSVGM